MTFQQNCHLPHNTRKDELRLQDGKENVRPFLGTSCVKDAKAQTNAKIPTQNTRTQLAFPRLKLKGLNTPLIVILPYKTKRWVERLQG